MKNACQATDKKKDAKKQTLQDKTEG